MSVTPMTLARLIDPAFLTNSDALILTAPTGKVVRLDAIRFCNTSGADVPVNWAIVPVSQTMATRYRQLSGAPCTANDVLDDNSGQVLNPGDMIYASAGTGGVVTITVSGIEIG